MPDFSMCRNQECEKRNHCYRFTVTPSKKKQSYQRFAPEKGKDRCEYFMKNNRL